MALRSIWKNNWKTILFFIACFSLLFFYNRFFSFMDEADNMMGAISLINGGDIYKGYFSQHTPFVYYFMSLFALLGVRDYETFRLCMSFTILLAWIFMYIRYSRFFGSATMKILMITYALSINFTWGHMVLSDVFSGYALLFLAFEVYIYFQNKALDTTSMITISLSIFVAIMSAFVSIYPIFALLFPTVLIEIHNIWFKKEKKSILPYFKLAIIVAAPFLIVALWYLITGNLKNFYFQAYQMNRIYYSNYNGGFGGDALGLFKATIVAWLNHIVYSLTVFSRDNLINTLLIIFNIIFVYTYYKSRKSLAIVLFIYLAFTGVRGYTSFHAIPYYLMSFFIMAFLINKYIISKHEKNVGHYKNVILKILVAMFFLMSVNNYLPNAGSYLFKPKGVMAHSEYDYYIQSLTNEDDKIWVSTLYQIYINNNRESAVRSAILLPWFLDAFDKEIFEDLENNKPKLIIFERDSVIWDKYKFSEFGKEVYDYIKQEYTCLNEDGAYERNIYIRNDFYNEAVALLWQTMPEIKDGMLVSNNTDIYLIEEHTKRHIINPEVFNKRGFKMSDVIMIENEVLNRIRTGKPIE